MPKINVLEFADVINRYDFIDTIIQYADPEKFQVDVCVRTENHNIASPKFPSRCRYKLLPGLSKTKIPFTAWNLSRLLKNWDIDVLHAHHYDQIIIGWLATRMHRKTKLVIGRHYSDSLYRIQKGIKQKFFLWLEKKANLAAACIIVPSQYIKRILTDWQKIDPAKVKVVYYGLNPEKYLFKDDQLTRKISAEFELQDKFVLATFGRLHEEKGHRFFLEAINNLRNEIKNMLVLFVGEGPERKNIENRIKQLNLSDLVKITGWRTDAIQIMRVVNVVVQPTLQEAFSQVMCEAMILGKPIIISDVSGTEDLIESGNSGIIVKKGDSECIVKAVKELYKSEEYQSRLGRNASARVKKILPLDKVVNDYVVIFSEVAKH